jgi:hypothetical protein
LDIHLYPDSKKDLLPKGALNIEWDDDRKYWVISTGRGTNRYLLYPWGDLFHPKGER